jgi:hypothetical protein
MQLANAMQIHVRTQQCAKAALFFFLGHVTGSKRLPFSAIYESGIPRPAARGEIDIDLSIS